MSIKIGLLVDSLRVPVWQSQIITSLKANPDISIELVVLNNSRIVTFTKYWVYKFFRKLDRILFKQTYDSFLRIDISELVKGVDILHTNPIQLTYTDEIPDMDLIAIKSKNLDVLVRFGFRILKGDILNTAPYGVWSLHHGDNAVNRGGPPAFWEVVNREAVTGVTLQKLSDDLDGGTVIDKAFIRTDVTSFNRNQVALYWAGVELLCSTLNHLAKNAGPVPASLDNMGVPPQGRGHVSFYSKPLYKNPTNAQALFIFGAFWLRRLKELVSRILSKPQWVLYYNVKKDLKTETSLFRYKKLTPPRGTDWADPFVVKHEEKFYLFFEELRPEDDGKAHISYLVFDAKGKQLSKQPTIVLKEPHHLSYPFLIAHEGEHYMIPEAASSNSVWLYKAEKFPAQWKRYGEVLSNTALYDPTLVFHEGLWYLFGTQKPFAGNSPDQYLYIYFTVDILKGTWQPHPMNPLTRDVRCARPAGKIFKDNGKLIRPVQLGAPKYGYGISFFEITKLSPTEFKQQHIQDILPHWRKGLRAVHTFNTEGGFSIVDAQG